MSKLFKNKTFLIIAAIIVFLVYLAFGINQYISREKSPVMFEYNQDSGIITFQVQPKYELDRYNIIDINGKLVECKTTDKTITFDINQIPKNRSNFINFNCRWSNIKNEKPVYPCKYEILRAENETCIMLYNEFDNPTKTVSYPPLR